MQPLPPHLVAEIRAGNCVAFLGAGFSAAVVPGWKQLLVRAADACHDGDAAERARALLAPAAPAARALEAAAQVLRDADPEGLLGSLRDQVGSVRPDAVMERRLAWLRGIPFAAVLTTNFDPLLAGSAPTPAAFLDVLRPRRHRWWEERFWGGERPGPRVVKLHGDLGDARVPPPPVVLSRRDYRELLYGTPGYLTFLRSLFAIRTVLYLGFSFTDAYLDELRSEVLALLGHGGLRDDDAPIAYAVVPDASEEDRRYWKRHEGVGILTYATGHPPAHEGFDAILGALHAATNPAHVLGRLLAGRRIVWLDPNPQHNDAGLEFLREAAGIAVAEPCRVEQVATVEAALAAAPRESPPDLVITHWGHQSAHGADGRPCATAEALLDRLHAAGIRAPVLVFADPQHAASNRMAAYRAGACDFVASWDGLFRAIARLFDPDDER